MLAVALSCAQAVDEEPSPVGPPPLSSHVMTFHDGLGMTVMFGGTDAGGVATNVLWGWDGDAWHRLAEGGPGPRLHAGMAYDSSRDRLVVYGGIRDRDSSYADVWEWDGSGWMERGSADGRDAADAADGAGPADAMGGRGPGVRDHHALAHDRTRGVTVLFGGQDARDEYPADTWVWNGLSWSRVAAAGPEPRGTHRLVWDGVRVVLVAGWSTNGELDDTWVWDGSVWSRLPTGGLTARGATRLAWDAARRELVLFGGLVEGERNGETWIRAGSGWRVVDVTGPSARNVHGMAYDPRRRRVVLYGGIGDEGKLGDLWEWDGARWMLRWPGQGTADRVEVSGAVGRRSR